jgi:hypothetical protein
MVQIRYHDLDRYTKSGSAMRDHPPCFISKMDDRWSTMQKDGCGAERSDPEDPEQSSN